MRTLFVTMMSYPPIGGEFLRNWQNMNVLSNFGKVAVFSVFDRPNNYRGIENENIEIWHHFNTETRSSAWAKSELGRQRLQQYGMNYYAPYLSSAARELDTLIVKFKPGIIVFEQIWLYPYLKVVKRHPCSIIFDNHNIEAPLYEETKASGAGWRAWVRKNLQVPLVKSHERELIRQAAQVWVCSEDDNQLLQELYGPVSYSHIIPNGINIADYDGARLKQEKLPAELRPSKQNILFLGNFLYIPNMEAAQLLIEQIFPAIKSLYPDSRLLLVGRGATPFMQDAAQKDPSIIVTGEIPDIKPYLAAASVMVVPLYKGGGTRFKILEAFAAGCPVVSTTKGAEGLDAEHGKHLLIADDVDAMVAGMVRIWSDDHLGRKLAEAAYELVQAAYSWDAVAKRVEEALKKLM